MTTTANTSKALMQSGPPFATAGVILEAMTTRDFARLAAAFAPDGAMEALLPRGLCECRGPEQIRAAFEGWFGDTEQFEVAEAAVGSVGPLIQLRWRILARKPNIGDGRFAAEQSSYARTNDDGLVERLALVCSGFHKLPDQPKETLP